jgi:hypothetical protein
MSILAPVGLLGQESVADFVRWRKIKGGLIRAP